MKIKNSNIWIATDGSQGMISQTKGLAQHFSKKIINIKVSLYFPWSILQPGFLPIFKGIFKNNLNYNNKNKPDILFTCGRKSVYFSLYLKKILSKKILTIHIQDPKVNVSKFDFVVAPNHDRLNGVNVIKSVGAIHQFTNSNLSNLKTYNVMKKNLISIIIGGKNKHYDFSEKNIKDLIRKIKRLKKNFPKFNFLVISSRRTNKKIYVLLQKELSNIAKVWDKQKEKNPYIFALKNSKFFIITSDSTSMISECAFTGKPIFVYHLPFRRQSKRIKYFHNEFERLKIVRKFLINSKLIKWKYKRLNEAKRISGILKERIIKGS